MNLLRNICLMAIVSTCLLASQTSLASNMSPDEAWAAMRQGNGRFSSGHPTHPNSGSARIQETATGQNPFVTLITCSDSRVPVERVFDQGIGDVFVIRVAGNVCDTDEIGSIEYGVDHLGTPLMIVLGHTSCGAVTAVATGAKLHGSIPALVDNIGPAVKRAEDITGLKGSALVPKAVEENVWQSISDLLQGSPATASLVSGHQLKVVGAVYNITDGTVEWLGEHPGQESLLAAGSTSPGGGHGSDTSASDGGEHGPTDAGHGADTEGEHGAEGDEEPEDEDSELKDVLAYSMARVNTMLMFLVIGMCVLALGLALLAFQSIKLKTPAVSLPKKKKPKPNPKPVEEPPAEESGAEPGEE